MTLQQIKEQAEIYISSSQIPECLEFAEKIEKSIISNNVPQTNPQAYKELTKIIFHLYLAAIPIIKPELFEKIISLNLIEALRPILASKASLIELIECRYSIYPEEIMKDYIRQDCLPWLKKNNQIIGAASLHLSQDRPQVSPTISHWLEYYDTITGVDLTSNFQRSRFFSNDPIVQSLTKEEKDALRQVIQLYDYLQSDDLVLYNDGAITDQEPEPKPASQTDQPSKSRPDLEESLPDRPSSNTKSPITYPKPGTVILTPKLPPKPKNLLNLKKPE